MSAAAQTFSESWYRVESARVSLRPHVQVRRQTYRGQRYHVLHDPLNNQFFRLRPAAWALVGRLRLDRTVGEAWRECMEVDPEEAPGQEQALRLLAQLHASDLLRTHASPDTAKLFERQEARRLRETKSTWMNAMFARFPLFDPDRFLQRIAPLVRLIWSPAGAVVWIGMVVAAIKVAIDHAPELRDSGQSILAPGNLPLLYLALILLKVLHEFGHASSCRRLGGEVHVVGVMLMIFMPLPFVDTTASWGFRSRWERALVGAAGMIIELFVAAIAVFVWSATGPGLLHSIAYNVLIVASVSTLLFNANPLLRFDGYYILSDLLEIPNLQSRAQRHLGYLIESKLFGVAGIHGDGATPGESRWLGIYGLLSTAYRLLLSWSILLFLANHYLVVGLVALVGCALAWVILPTFRGLQYLLASPRLARQRPRAWAATLGLVGVPLVLLSLVPVSSNFRAPGVLEAVAHPQVTTQLPAKFAELLVPSGEHVTKGQKLIQLRNPELDLEMAGAKSEQTEVQALLGLVQQEGAADVKPIEARLHAVEKRLARLHELEAELTVCAPEGGIWIAPDVHEYRETWLPRGVELGQIVNPAGYQFTAVVSQEDAARLFGREIRGAQVRLRGQADLPLAVSQQTIIPAERTRLPSAALGWRGGGDIATEASDPSGLTARERFFEVRAQLAPLPADTVAVLRHGLSGRIRFELPREPLLSQWWRKLGQVFQKRGVST